jgi:hypothetical protein
MTRDDITLLAREAHRRVVTDDYPGHTGQLDAWTLALLERFAALVAAAERDRWSRLLEDRAVACERAAENTGDPKYDAIARTLMSVREEGLK